MYKLIATDLDGTLLNSFGEVSEETKLALQKAKEQGLVKYFANPLFLFFNKTDEERRKNLRLSNVRGDHFRP